MSPAGIWLMLGMRHMKNLHATNRQVQAVLLGAGGVKSLPGSKGHASTSLEWILHALKQQHVRDITLIGGHEIERTSAQYPHIRFTFNSAWKQTWTVSSLITAREKLLERDTIISYVDVVFRPSLIASLLEGKRGDFTIVVDRQWRSRYPGRTALSLRKAEKICSDASGHVTRASRTRFENEAVGEYTGLLYLSRRGAQKVSKLWEERSLRTEGTRPSQAGFTDLFTWLIEAGETIHTVFTDGEWAELDEPSDFGRFVFGTKSQTLARLRPVLKHGVILPQFTFTVKEWHTEPDAVIARMRQEIPSPLLVVRSSALREDSLTSSYAGAFISVLHVKGNDAHAIRRAVRKVLKSFGKEVDGEDQILVQPQVTNVAMSGVLFSCDLRTGAPYYSIHYDRSGSTQSITAGKRTSAVHCSIFRGVDTPPPDAHMARLLTCAREIERLAGGAPIDMEFCFDRRGRLFVFQARPLTSTETVRNFFAHDIEPLLRDAKEQVRQRLKKKQHLAGRTTILGDMPDWNPAELIGSHPRPLAASLFDELITRSAWRDARALLGYFNPSPERLLVLLAGHPYIDVRNSLNSYTPAALPSPLRGKLVDESLDYLLAHPDAHDKLEFEVATTCYSPSLRKRMKRWKDAGCTQEEIMEIERTFRTHTDGILRGGFRSIGELIGDVRRLDERRRGALAHRADFAPADLARFLIDDCMELGTIPFSALARMAFISQTWLKALRDDGIIAPKSYDRFLGSLHTVTAEMGKQVDEVVRGRLPQQAFLAAYGHLRPGTYEIDSWRYDEKPDLYFHAAKTGRAAVRKEEERKAFAWNGKERGTIARFLEKNGLHLSPEELTAFFSQSIEGREEAKFLFSRNVSDVLSLFAAWGEGHGCTREELSFLSLPDLVAFLSLPYDADAAASLRSHVEAARRRYAQESLVLMPQLLTAPEDLEWIAADHTRPNFITCKRAAGDVAVLGDLHRKPDLAGKIVLIESADPGYDWIFTHGIAGLVTKYGGAGSHMAIRCAEFGLPAAIGVGMQFEELLGKRTIRLDCENRTIA